MNLDVGDSVEDHPLQGFEEAWAILLLGVKERIAGWPATRILKLCCNFRPTGCPSGDSRPPYILVSTVPERLIVIGKKEPDSLRRLARELGEAIFDISREPNLAVSG
jgi:hypothetical protein